MSTKPQTRPGKRIAAQSKPLTIAELLESQGDCLIHEEFLELIGVKTDLDLSAKERHERMQHVSDCHRCNVLFTQLRDANKALEAATRKAGARGAKRPPAQRSRPRKADMSASAR